VEGEVDLGGRAVSFGASSSLRFRDLPGYVGRVWVACELQLELKPLGVILRSWLDVPSGRGAGVR
jgi:hypothetical protein